MPTYKSEISWHMGSLTYNQTNEQEQELCLILVMYLNEHSYAFTYN